MKKEIPTGAVVAALVLVVLVIGFLAYRTFIGTDPTVSNITPQQLKQMNDQKMKAMTTRRDSMGRPIEGERVPATRPVPQ